MKKLKVWQYTLPPLRGEGWAIIILREDGYFSTVSDFGNYAYLWTSTGCKDFREFLLTADRDWHYFAKKLNPKTHVDNRESIKNLLEELFRRRRQRKISKEDARNIFEIIGTYDEDWEGLLRDQDTDLTREFPETWNYTITSLDSDVIGFCQKILPRLNVILRKQLKKS